jgi:molybdopterin molybdotransferase
MSQEHDDMLWRPSAVEVVVRRRRSVLADFRTETVGVDSLAGRVLAEPIVAECDLPAHDQATIDGYAVDATRDYPFSVRSDEVFPEDKPPSLAAGEAVEVATGASLPSEANAVIKREDATVEDGCLDGPNIDPGTYTYARASNASAGETLFEAGERLAAKDAILLGDLGYDTVTVAEPFSTGILATMRL